MENGEEEVEFTTLADALLGPVRDRNTISNKKETEQTSQRHSRGTHPTQSSSNLPRIINGNGEKRPKRQQSKSLFSHLSLSGSQDKPRDDTDTSKYLPYSSVSFPRISLASLETSQQSNQNNNDSEDDEGNSEAAGKQKAELDSMWMVGFLDHEEQTETSATLGDLNHFVSLPEGKVLPRAAIELNKVYNKDRAKRKARERRLEKLTPAQLRRLKSKEKATAQLTAAQLERLKEIERECDQAALVPKKAFQRQKKRSMNIYKRENHKIRKALRDKNPGKATAAIIRSRALEELFELERQNIQAATRIQTMWRVYRARQMWKLVVRKSKSIKQIQRVVRGMLARTLVRVWLLRRSWLVIVSQSCIRGFLSRKRTRQLRERSNHSSCLIQKIIRGFLARIRADYYRSAKAATTIQRLWRGSVARVSADRMWLNQQVTLIQKIMRGMLGRKAFRLRFQEANQAAILLQRNVRAMFDRWKRNDLLWHRETERRREFIEVLRAEDEYYCEKRDRLLTNIKEVLQCDQALEFAKAQYYEMQQMIVEKEYDFLCMIHERRIADRRAVEQGWVSELDRFVDEHRQFVTNAKLEYLFVGLPYYRQLLQQKTQLDQELEEINWHIEQVRRAREEEVEELYQRELQVEWELKRRERRRRIADEKRKWRVTWFTEDGKVDQRKRPGRPWDPSVFAGPERDTFNIGTVNLLAGASMQEDVSGFQMLTEQVAMQNAQNEFVQYGALMKPLMQGMEEMTEAVAILSLRNSLSKQQQQQHGLDPRTEVYDENDIDIEDLDEES